MGLSIREIIDRKKPPEESIPIVVDGDLAAEYTRLEVQLRDAGPAQSLADDGAVEVLTARMEALRARMLESRVFFHLRALREPDWSPYRAALPTKRDEQTEEEAAEEYHRWLCSMLAATCVEPVMTPDEVHDLFEVLSSGEWSSLAGSALALNTARQDVPFSEAASAIFRRYAGKSRRPEPSTVLDQSSLADSAAPSPPTNTTTPPGE